jgi:hypothetical protein
LEWVPDNRGKTWIQRPLTSSDLDSQRWRDDAARRLKAYPTVV